MKKVVIVVEDGMVQSVYGSASSEQIDIEVLDMDTTDLDMQNILDDRLGTVRQHLVKIY